MKSMVFEMDFGGNNNNGSEIAIALSTLLYIRQPLYIVFILQHS